MSDEQIYALYKEQFDLLNDNLDDLIHAAQTAEQGHAILESWRQAHLNYLKALNRIFTNGGAVVSSLAAQFAQAEQDLNQALTRLQNDVTVIGAVSSVIQTAVSKGTQLVNA